MKPERIEYLKKLIKEIRQDFLQPIEVIEDDPVFDGKYLDIALLCDVVEKEVIEAWNTRTDNWISVEERLPPKDSTVLLYDSMHNEVHTTEINFAPKRLDADYTHWQPLPAPPEEEK